MKLLKYVLLIAILIAVGFISLSISIGSLVIYLFCKTEKTFFWIKNGNYKPIRHTRAYGIKRKHLRKAMLLTKNDKF